MDLLVNNENRFKNNQLFHWDYLAFETSEKYLVLRLLRAPSSASAEDPANGTLIGVVMRV